MADNYRVPNTNERISIERYDEVVSDKNGHNYWHRSKFWPHESAQKPERFRCTRCVFHNRLLPTVRRPTCVTNMSSTVIDDIYIYIYMKCAGYDTIDSKILMIDISDHYPIIACMGVTKGNIKQPLVFECRNFGQPGIDCLLHWLTQCGMT